jgi:methylase of polypeptide subunit release factors
VNFATHGETTDLNTFVPIFLREKIFFKYTPESFDLVISNPPFSRKLEVFKRLNELGKPWMMLCNIMCLNYMEIGNYFADNPCRLLIPDKRVSFDGNPSSFCSGYICKDILPKDLIFTKMKNCNSGKNFIPSRMIESL